MAELGVGDSTLGKVINNRKDKANLEEMPQNQFLFLNFARALSYQVNMSPMIINRFFELNSAQYSC